MAVVSPTLGQTTSKSITVLSFPASEPKGWDDMLKLKKYDWCCVWTGNNNSPKEEWYFPWQHNLQKILADKEAMHQENERLKAAAEAGRAKAKADAEATGKSGWGWSGCSGTATMKMLVVAPRSKVFGVGQTIEITQDLKGLDFDIVPIEAFEKLNKAIQDCNDRTASEGYEDMDCDQSERRNNLEGRFQQGKDNIAMSGLQFTREDGSRFRA